MKLEYVDSSHSYWLNGKRAKSASKVAKIASDGYALEIYGKRQVAIGMTLDKTLVEDVAVDIDNREKINEVCERAEFVAKSHARANRGTQRHRVFELLLLGQTDRFITDQQRADAEVLARTLDRYRLEPPAPHLVEGFVAWPDQYVVGRFDAYLRHEGRHVLTDLKSGVNAVKYPHATVVQCALYRFAPHISAAVTHNGDRSMVTEWTVAPGDADDEIAYVIHCDDGHDVGELWRLDLKEGRAGAELALSVVEWRKRRSYGREMANKVESGTEPFPPSPTHSLDDVRREFTELAPAEQEMFKRLKAERSLASDDPAGLAKVLDDIRYLRVEPPLERPEASTSPPPPTQTHSDPIDEGPDIGDVDLAPLGRIFDALSEDAADWFADLIAQGRGTHSWEMRAGFHRTLRRYEIYRGLIHLAASDVFREIGADAVNETVLEPIIWAASGHDDAVLFANVNPGVALGALNVAQAQTFSMLVDDLLASRRQTIIDEHTGRWRLDPAA
jgi:hypothetical protein